MKTWLQAFLAFCLVMLVVSAQDAQDVPEKRPALLSRYGRAVLPRYGKRSMRQEGDLVLCHRLLDGELACAPFGENRDY